jgi:hypothetical protein
VSSESYRNRLEKDTSTDHQPFLLLLLGGGFDVERSFSFEEILH